jgi:hypothetical protein
MKQKREVVASRKRIFGLGSHGIETEVQIADNASTDGSQAIA